MKEQPPQIFIAQNSQLQTKTVGSKSSDIHCRLHERRTVYHSLRLLLEVSCDLKSRRRTSAPDSKAGILRSNILLNMDSLTLCMRSLPPCIFFISSPVYPGSMNAIAYYFVNAMESETSAIARGLRRHDPDLLDRLIEQYQHRLLRYLIYLSGNRELAEDLFQETWIRVLERGHQYDGKHEFSTWLYAVARNLTIDYLRKKSPVSLDGLMEDEEHAPLEPADTRPSAWDLLAQRQQSERISAALVGIPAECREAIVLRFQEGLTLDEIAAVTGARLGTVKSRLYRGLNLLMSRLKGAGTRA